MNAPTFRAMRIAAVRSIHPAARDTEGCNNSVTRHAKRLPVYSADHSARGACTLTLLRFRFCVI